VTQLVLRGNGVLDAGAGVCLLLATWDGLYDRVGLPDPDPAIYAQVGGAFAVGFAYVLWIAPRDAKMTRVLSAMSALVNVLLALLALAWLADTHAELPGHDVLALALAVPPLVGLAIVEGAIASRNVAMLLPSD
jgi:hypothetical protein